MSSGDILTKCDVAELLQVSERTVERWMAEGSLPYSPLPKRGVWLLNYRFLYMVLAANRH